MNRKVELAFLPAAMEVEQTPPSPAGRAILWIILALFVIALLWASVGRVDVVAIAKGRIIASGHSKTVQPLEIGTVTAIQVREGQYVSAGETLLLLDPTSAQADVDRLIGERDAVKRAIARYRQLGDWLVQPLPPETVELRVIGDALILGQWQEYQDRRQVLFREREQRQAERRSALQQVEKLGAILPILSQRAADQKGLVEQKLLPKQPYLEIEQERLETLHDLRTHEDRVREHDAALQTLEARIRHMQSEFRSKVTERLDHAEQELDRVAQELIKARARFRSRTINAPVSGTVQQLQVHNVGAIVTPAQALMVVVPDANSLEVEATLENKDIGFVEVGQAVEIKVDTFPFTRYGTIHGEVIGLSNDAIADERGGLVYRMRVAMARATVDVNGAMVALLPGMTVTVESKTGTRRMIEFFLSPLLRYAQESARER
jgi:hemolysin D